jgi:hypothetical protein
MGRTLTLVCLLALFSACRPLADQRWAVRMFGPEAVAATEAYGSQTGTATLDHGAFDALLRTHVRDGEVDYDGIVADRAKLDAYLQLLADAPFGSLSRDAKLALLINLYNAGTLALIADHWPLSSIKDIEESKRWNAVRFRVADTDVSLDDIENRWLRAKFVEPRIHFAINCASVGCPPLRSEAYTAGKLEVQLQEQTVQMHEDGPWLRMEGNTLHLTRLYLWYAGDFEASAGTITAFVAQYRPELKGTSPTIAWLDYDWSVNRTR